jgi:hypothetical protein
MASHEIHLKNREILHKLNKNSLEICNVLNALSKKVIDCLMI